MPSHFPCYARHNFCTAPLHTTKSVLTGSFCCCRYNPDEAKFDKPDETQDGSSVGGARRKSIKASVKKSKKKPSKGNENTDPNVKSKENTVQQIEPNKDLTEQVERGVGSEIEKTDPTL